MEPEIAEDLESLLSHSVVARNHSVWLARAHHDLSNIMRFKQEIVIINNPDFSVLCWPATATGPARLGNSRRCNYPFCHAKCLEDHSQIESLFEAFQIFRRGHDKCQPYIIVSIIRMWCCFMEDIAHGAECKKQRSFRAAYFIPESAGAEVLIHRNARVKQQRCQYRTYLSIDVKKREASIKRIV